GSSAAAIRRASDKAAFPRRLQRCGVVCPPTHTLPPGAAWGEWRRAARAIGYPAVVKPRRGAGCDGVRLVRNPVELRQAADWARSADDREWRLLQRFVPGVAASVSLLADGCNALALAVNAQSVRSGGAFRYSGGATPL